MTLDLETVHAPTVHFPAPPSWWAEPRRFANWKRKFLPLLDNLSSRFNVVFVPVGATEQQKGRVHSAVNAAAIATRFRRGCIDCGSSGPMNGIRCTTCC